MSPVDAAGAAGRRSICLCMIVKDEIDVLGRCLESCLGLIDTWVICDTGSSDGTQDLIRSVLGHIPGELHQHEWVDFGHNRTELMKLSRGKADYLLVVDADTTVEMIGDPLTGLTDDAYLIRHAETTEYHTKRLVSGRLDWRYVGAAHEYITCDEERTTGRLDDLMIRAHSVGGMRHGRWERDAELLLAALRRDPSDARSMFYLAQTYRDLGEHTEDPELLRRAAEGYESRTAMGGWDEEVYVAWHQAGLLREALDEWPAAMDAFVHAWQMRPQRLEAVHDLASGLIERERYHSAYRFTSLAVESAPLRAPADLLFVARWMYEWGLLFQHSIAAYWCGHYDVSITACQRLLAIADLPDEHRRLTERNMQYALREKVRVVTERTPA